MIASPVARPPRSLGPVSVSALVVASMIGSGVFTTSGFALADLGRREWVLLAWAVGGVVATCGALCYGALGRLIPESGGEYTFLTRLWHPLAGFLAGWISLFAGFTAPIAAAALAMSAYLAPVVGEGGRPEWIGSLAILAATALHGVSAATGVLLQNLAVAAKLIAIAGFIGVAAFVAGDPAPGPTPPLQVPVFAASLVWISFAYSGWNAAVYVASEIREPERTLSRSLVLATVTVTALYLLLNTAFLYAAPVEVLAGRADIGAAAARALGGPVLAAALSCIVALALATSISSLMMAGPRVYARMAREGALPHWFRESSGPPRAALALQAGLALLVVWFSELAQVLRYIGFTLGLSSAAAVLALLAWRRREGAQRVPIPGYPWIPAVFLLATLGASTGLILHSPGEALAGLVTIALGVPLYYWSRTRR